MAIRGDVVYLFNIYAIYRSETRMCSVMSRHRYLFGRHANGGLRTSLELRSGSGAAAVALSWCRLRKVARKVLDSWYIVLRIAGCSHFWNRAEQLGELSSSWIDGARIGGCARHEDVTTSVTKDVQLRATAGHIALRKKYGHNNPVKPQSTSSRFTSWFT